MCGSRRLSSHDRFFSWGSDGRSRVGRARAREVTSTLFRLFPRPPTHEPLRLSHTAQSTIPFFCGMRWAMGYVVRRVSLGSRQPPRSLLASTAAPASTHANARSRHSYPRLRIYYGIVSNSCGCALQKHGGGATRSGLGSSLMPGRRRRAACAKLRMPSAHAAPPSR